MAVITLKPGLGQKLEQSRPPEEGLHRVRCYTPDRTKYHKGDGGTIIPRAKPGKNVGGSEGFEPGAQQFALVEQDEASGQRRAIVEVDPTKITPEASRAAYESATRETQDPDERAILAYAKLGVKVANMDVDEAPTIDRSSNPLMAGYVTPAAGLRDIQQPQGQPMPAPDPVSLQPLPRAVATPAQVPQPISPQPALPAATDPNMANMMAVLMQGQQQMVNALQQLAQPTTVATSPPAAPATAPVAETPAIPPVAEEPVSQETQELHSTVHKAVDKAYELLKIPELSLEPKPPRYQVQFDMGEGGIFQTAYHWVGVHGKGLFLIYDTRFEYGAMFSPPDRGNKPMQVTLPDHDKVFSCYSSNFVHPFGVFKIINLIIEEQGTGGEPPAALHEEPETPPLLSDSLGSILGTEGA